MTLVEAMQAGCVPVVMDTFAAVHDIIDDGVNGFIVPAEDIPAFRRATEVLMNDEALRSRMGTAAMEKVRRFDPDGIVSRWQTLLEDIMR